MNTTKQGKKLYPRKMLFAIIFLYVLLISAFSTEKTKIRVGIYDSESYYGTSSNDSENTYGYAYLNEIKANVPVTFEYVYGTWTKCLEMLENGEIDLLDTAQYTLEHAEKFNFSKHSTGVNYTKIFTRVDNDSLNFNDFASFDGITIGMQAESNTIRCFLNFAQKNNFTTINKEYDSFEDLKEALGSSEIDAIITTSLEQIDGKILSRFDSFPYFMMTNKNKPEISSLINEALDLIQIENPLFNYDLYKQYYSYEFDSCMLSEYEQEYIQNHKPITVMYDSFFPPFESYSEEKKGPEGINTEIFFRIVEKTGLKINLVHGYTYDQAITAISNKEVDMLLSYDTNREKTKELDIVLSKTYLSTPLGIVGRSTVIYKNAIFAIPKIYPLYYEFIKIHFPNNSILLYNDIIDCYEAIEKGFADFTMENMYAITNTLQSGKYPSLVFSSVTALYDHFSFAFKSDIDPLIVDIFNKGITAVTNTDLEGMLLEFSTNQITNTTFEQFIKIYKRIIFTIILVIVIILIFITSLNINAHRISKQKLYEMAYIDPLTRLGNLNKFKLDIKQILENNPDKKYVIVKMDIHCFNLINEMHGFQTGDLVLCTIAKEMKEIVNTRGGVAARIGSDSFCILVEIKDELESNEKKDLGQAFKDIVHEKTGCALQFTTGRYFISLGETDANLIFEKANYAHNVAKKNRAISEIFDYDKNMQQKAMNDRKMESRMATSLANEDFVVFLQAKFSLGDKEELVGAEALVRWKWYDQNEVSITSPEEFIPLFERNGYITHLDMYMFDQVCKIIASWIAEEIPIIPVSVNFSRLHLNNKHFVQNLIEIAERYNVPKKYLEIELTETAIVDIEEVLEKVLHQLHEAGFKLSMDDFGAGYSSLGLLKNLPVDIIKIDRNFFKDAKDNKRAEIVIAKIMEMAKELGIVTVAEGVETIEHIEFLHSVGCNIVQGFYYAKPISKEEFTEKMRKK